MATLWTKIETWIGGEVTAVEAALSTDEQELLVLVKPLFAAAETAALQDLTIFIRGVLVEVENPSTKDLSDLEDFVTTGLKTLGSSLLPVAQALGSALLQALIGLILASLPAVAKAV